MNNIQAALDATAFFVVIPVVVYMCAAFAVQALKLAKMIHPENFLAYPRLLLTVFTEAVLHVASRHRLDEYSLSTGLAVFAASGLLGLNPRPACAAMLLAIALFNTVRPRRKKATQTV